MSRILPHPLASAGLFVLWLLLNQTVAPGPVLVAIAVALLGGLMLARLRPARVRVARPGLVLRLAGVVALDVIRSNLAVAQVILGRKRSRRSGFIRIQLETRNPWALAALALILTATPGTAWVEFDAEEGWLLLHVLDLIDEESWAHIVRERYERPLMEIFQ
jgi:multicomponent K+:H+ antiporter subunit E